MPEFELPPSPRVVGLSLSGEAPCIITAEENRALCESIGAVPAPDGSAHSIYFFVATHVGMGKTIAGLCALCDFDVEDGPMLASSKVTFQHALMTGQPYHVTGEILGLTRKPSRKLGVMDLVEYELRLSLPDGSPVLTTTNVWVLPRGRRKWPGETDTTRDLGDDMERWGCKGVSDMALAAGQLLAPLRIESVSTEGMKRWAEFLRDPNPIHLDSAVVQAKGWGNRVINQGPANLGYIITMLLAAHPGAMLEALDVRYVDNVFGGEAVEAGGKVTGASDARPGRCPRITCDVWLRAVARDFAITGTAVLAIPT